MSRKSIILWTIAAVILIPFFAMWIWKEVTTGDEDYVEKKIAENQPGAKDDGKTSKSAAAQTPTMQTPTPPVQQKTPTPPIEEKKPEEPPKEEEKKDETADWKKFRSEKNKYEFKYPKDTTVNGDEDLMALEKEKKIWRIRIYENKKKTDLEIWYNGYFTEKERLNCASGSSSLKIGTYDTKFYDPKTEPNICKTDGHWAISPDKSKVVKVSVGEETVENINKILATFKFDE
jgi:hypothetical protein